MRFGPFVALVLLIFFGERANAQLVYGTTTAANLILIDTSTLAVTVVGPVTGSPNPDWITWHPGEDAIYGINSASSGQSLVRLNRHTGAGTVVASLGAWADVGSYESIEYVPSLDRFVVSRGTPSSPQYSVDLYSMDTLGNVTLLGSNSADKDGSVYDSMRDRFYTADSNGSPNLALTNLGTGGIISLHPTVPFNANDMAYSPSEDVIFTPIFGTENFYRGVISDEGPAFTYTFTLQGQTTGHFISGLAYVTPVPEPSGLWLVALGAGCAAMAGRRALRAAPAKPAWRVLQKSVSHR